jgi:hypothetical protein
MVMTQIPEAKKPAAKLKPAAMPKPKPVKVAAPKTKKGQDVRYGDVPAPSPVSDPTQVDITQLQPGQKQALEIKLAKGVTLSADVKQEIAQLETSKKQAVNAKNILLVDQIEGLQDQLKKLEKKITTRITALKKKLKVVPPDVAAWLDRIQTDCTQYLKEVKKAKAWLYRGTSGPDAFVAKSWLTRQPKDSNREAQVLFDQMLAQLGFVALRGNSIFTTSGFWHTKEFGDKTYVIFPVDGASHYTYTNQGDIVLDHPYDVGIDADMVNTLKQELLPYVKDDKAKLGKKKPSMSLKELLYQVENRWNSWYSAQKALMAYVKKTPTHGIPAKFLDPDLDKQLLTIDVFAKKWEPHQGNLALALKHEWEVYVSGAYYALEVEAYGDFIAARFGVKVESANEPRSYKW